MYYDLCRIFETANNQFIKDEKELFLMNVSERTLCGSLMVYLYEILKSTKFKNYKVDVEYNRNIGGKLKTIIKTLKGLDTKIINITCDLIVHS